MGRMSHKDIEWGIAQSILSKYDLWSVENLQGITKVSRAWWVYQATTQKIGIRMGEEHYFRRTEVRDLLKHKDLKDDVDKEIVEFFETGKWYTSGQLSKDECWRR